MSLRGRGAARVDNDDLEIGPPRLRVLDAPEEHRMRPRRIRSGDEEAIRELDIVVARGRGVRAEGRLVACDRARHAKARIRIDVVRADQRARELVEREVVFGEKLARNVEADGIGTVLLDRLGVAVGHVLERVAPRDARARLRTRAAHFRVQRAAGEAGGEVQRLALRAELSAVRRVIRVAANAGDAAIFGIDQDSASDTAVAARGFNGIHPSPPTPLPMRGARGDSWR
jgi:hypothetical protein